MLVAAPPLLGQHLFIDGKVGAMPNLKCARWLLAAIACLLEMRMLGQPRAYRQGEAVVAFVVIAESHIFLHLYPAPAMSYVDIFSCRPFDRLRAINFVSQSLRMTEVTSRQINRGTE